MKHVRDWGDLRQFGIDMLTGEACALSYRVLVDVTERGRQIVRSLFSLPMDVKLQENWNGGSTQDPHVGSIMLTYDMAVPLAIFALRADGASAVHWLRHNGEQHVYGAYSVEDRQKLEWGYEHGIYERIRIFSFKPIPGVTSADGLTNVHQMSGRAM